MGIKQSSSLFRLFAHFLIHALPTGSHNSILTRHPSVQSTFKLGAESELAHGVGLFVTEKNTLRGEGLVLHTIEASSDVANLGMGRVGGLDSRSERRSHAVGAETNRVSVLLSVSLLLVGLRLTVGLGMSVRGGPRQ